MSRYDELMSIVPEDSVELVKSVVEDVVFLEERLEELKQLPFIEVNSKNPVKQRSTPAGKLYKEFLQQYINCIKMIESIIYRDKKLDSDEAEESPLRKWFRENANQREKNMDA